MIFEWGDGPWKTKDKMTTAHAKANDIKTYKHILSHIIKLLLIIFYFYHWKPMMCGTWWFWCLLKQKQETREVVCFLVVHPLVKLVLFGCPWLERCICGMFEIASQSLSWFCKLYRSCFRDIPPTTRNARSWLGMVIELLKNKKLHLHTRSQPLDECMVAPLWMSALLYQTSRPQAETCTMHGRLHQQKRKQHSSWNLS